MKPPHYSDMLAHSIKDNLDEHEWFEPSRVEKAGEDSSTRYIEVVDNDGNIYKVTVEKST